MKQPFSSIYTLNQVILPTQNLDHLFNVIGIITSYRLPITSYQYVFYGVVKRELLSQLINQRIKHYRRTLTIPS